MQVMNIKQHGKAQVYIGRPSVYGNPFRPTERSAAAHHKVCTQYKKYLWRKLCNSPSFVLQVRGLKGKTLGCFCKPLPCHGDVLAAAIAWLHSDEGKAVFDTQGKRCA